MIKLNVERKSIRESLNLLKQLADFLPSKKETVAAWVIGDVAQFCLTRALPRDFLLAIQILNRGRIKLSVLKGTESFQGSGFCSLFVCWHVLTCFRQKSQNLFLFSP